MSQSVWSTDINSLCFPRALVLRKGPLIRVWKAVPLEISLLVEYPSSGVICRHSDLCSPLPIWKWGFHGSAGKGRLGSFSKTFNKCLHGMKFSCPTIPQGQEMLSSAETWKGQRWDCKFPSVPAVWHLLFQKSFVSDALVVRDLSYHVLLQNPSFTNSQYSRVLDKHVPLTWW